MKYNFDSIFFFLIFFITIQQFIGRIFSVHSDECTLQQ